MILSNSGMETSHINLSKDKKVTLIIQESTGIFLVSCPNELKINQYVEFNAYIKGISCLKTVNTKVNVSCSVCGLLFTKNIMRVQGNKMYNSFVLNNDKKIHSCDSLNLENSSFSSNKISREFINPIIVRYLNVEICQSKKEDSYSYENISNLPILCICDENLLSKFPVWEKVKISGIVKTRPEGNSTNNFNKDRADNFYSKIIEVYNIENCEENLKPTQPGLDNFSRLSLNNIESSLNSLVPYSQEDLFNFEKISHFKCLSTYLIINLINSKISSNLDFMNFLSFYFMLSKNEGLKIHVVDLTKSDRLRVNLNPLRNLSENLIYHDLNSDCKSNDDLVIQKDTLAGKNFKEDFILKFAKIFSSHNKLLFLDNLPNNINQNLLTFLTLNMLSPSVNVMSNLTENSNSFLCSEFKSFSSLLTTSKNVEVYSSNISQIIQNCDFAVFYSDKLDTQKDRTRTNQIIENQFNMKKRKYSDISNQVTQRTQILPTQNGYGTTQFSGTQIKINSNGNLSQVFTEEDLYALDTHTFNEFYKKIIKDDLEAIKKEIFLNDSFIRDSNFLMKYIKFISEFTSPVISSNLNAMISHLSQHLIKCFSDLTNFELICFDSNGSNLNRIITKISLINARINMKKEVEYEDVLRAYVFTKEIVQQNFIFCLGNKRENVQKTKKNKMTFVMDKIKQICALNSRKTFFKNEIVEACEYADIKEDLEKIIENLNYMGFMIKLNSEEYQLIN
jgi:hypothetical protein